MMMNKVLGIVLLLLLAAAGGAECRRHPDRDHRRAMLFVFGDSFVDAGNVAPTSQKSEASRQWFYPYGSSDSAHHNNPTGRFSDGLVQSDFLARMLGFDESPPAHRLQQSNNNDLDASGVNFATAMAGAYDNLSRQIDQLSRLVRRGTIEDRDLDHSVALIAFNGNTDYARVTTSTGSDQVMALSDQVTDAIADGVRRLLDLGVSKVMVNSLPPLGCAPFDAQMFNYEHCDAAANRVSDMHNKALSKKLDPLDDVLVLDVNSIFSDLARGNYMACCTGTDKNSKRNGAYCGREDARGTPQYTLCTNPQNVFYWDYMHPTQAGWNAVMDRLQGSIQDFLHNN